MNLVLKKGGKIFLKKWVYNAEIEKGKYQKTFVNFQDKENIDDSYLLSLLQYDVQLEKGFTVRDWFKLIIKSFRLSLAKREAWIFRKGDGQTSLFPFFFLCFLFCR